MGMYVWLTFDMPTKYFPVKRSENPRATDIRNLVPTKILGRPCEANEFTKVNIKSTFLSAS